MKAARVVAPASMRLPAVQPLEAPASWLTRAAMSQGVDVKTLLTYLGIEQSNPDVDQVVLSEELPSIIRLCGLHPGAFCAARRIFGATHTLGKARARLLLTSASGEPRYRFCPSCLSEERPAFVGIHCRFTCWRLCPVHQCLLEDACHQCGAELKLPASLVRERPSKSPCVLISTRN